MNKANKIFCLGSLNYFNPNQSNNIKYFTANVKDKCSKCIPEM